MRLSKTNYIAWWKCPHNAWYRVNDKERFSTFVDEGSLARMATGQSVDELARDLFPGGITLGLGLEKESALAIAERKSALFQPQFITSSCITLCDVLKLTHAGDSYDLLEVKSSTTGNKANLEEYIRDIAFQVLVLRENNVPLNKYYVVRLNSEYIRDGEVDLERLFMKTDLTDNVNAVLDEVAAEVEQAYRAINEKRPPLGRHGCLYLGRGNHCEMFPVIHPEVPEYSVHDLSRVSGKKLLLLIDSGIMRIADIPADFELADKQATQVRLEKGKVVEVDVELLREFLDGLIFPLSFLDFETFGAAVPRFNKFKPYANIVFQFSLHTIEKGAADPVHHEVLYLGHENPDRIILEGLCSALPPMGSILVWNKSFEISRLKEMAARQPDYQVRVSFIIDRIVDLRDVVSKGIYLHHGFRGRESIKDVLPILSSESYGSLDVEGGVDAMNDWNSIVMGLVDGGKAKQLEQGLRDYCRLDTYGMYLIWLHLREKSGSSKKD